jgi:hypothetical protein
MTTNLHDKMLAAIDALFSASDGDERDQAEEQLLDVRDEILKHKLAAESLTEGLRLDDWNKIGCVNHDCDKCKAQQAPDYAWPTVQDYEADVGFKVNDAFQMGWSMARTTNDLFKQMGAAHDNTD